MKHLAIIADGNRRWARANELPTRSGYLQGLVAVERCCEWAISRSVKNLTVFCFSTENWGRPQNEVDLLMDLARWYFTEQREWYIIRGIQVRFIGRRDRFKKDLHDMIYRMEDETSGGNQLTLTLCLDYGGRDEIVRAIAEGARTEEEITAKLSYGLADPDAILRTGGDTRLSNFMLWQSAYSELFFIKTLFPDLDYFVLDSVLEEYAGRKRNYGH